MRCERRSRIRARTLGVLAIIVTTVTSVAGGLSFNKIWLEWRQRLLAGDEQQAWALMQQAAEAGYVLTGLDDEPRGRKWVCPMKLDHDLQQLSYRLKTATGSTRDKLQGQRRVYSAALEWLEGEIGLDLEQRARMEDHDRDCRTFAELPTSIRPALRHWYNRDLAHWKPSGLPATAEVLSVLPWKKLEREFFQHGYVVVDDALGSAAYTQLLQFTRESDSFTKIDFPYIGAYPPRFGFGPERDLVRELSRSMPAVFRGSPLQMLWCYKYLYPRLNLSRRSRARWKEVYPRLASDLKHGSTLHNDAATVNVNLMLSAQSAKLKGGGLQIYLCDAVQGRTDLDIENSKEMAGRVADCPMVTVPFKPNRMVIFASSLMHKTQPFLFKLGFRNARTFMTFLFGKALTAQQHAESVPQEHRIAFAQNVLRHPLKASDSMDDL